MRTSEPPALATWLLTRFASGEKCESLIGDLMEQYQQGRSSAWYWRQAISAIGSGFAVQTRAHWWLAIVVVGINVLWPYAYMSFIWRWVRVLNAWYPRLIDWLLTTDLNSLRHFIYHIHLGWLTSAVVICTMLASFSWILVGLFPRQRGMILTVFLLSNFWQCVPGLGRAFENWLQDPVNPLWFFNLFWFVLWVFVTAPLSILWGGRPRHQLNKLIHF